MARPIREQLTPTQMKVIQELVSKDITGKTNEMIAEENDINIVTLYRWKRNKLFNDKLLEVAEEFNRSFLSDTYVQLRGIINNPRTNTGHKIKALELALKNQGRLKEVQDNKVEVSVDNSAMDVLKRLGLDK